ncbi:MAG: nucleotide exchange factor GrpE [Lachnospiraceae bacterium]|nr:nucleotide exchange factor GrpE [Lachnospiraceae bacterium]
MKQEEAIQEEELQREAAKAEAEQEQQEPEAETAKEQEAEEEAPEGSKEPKEQKEKSEKSFLGKKKKKKDPREEKIEELEDRVKRQMAEFDNFRKRTEKEKSHMYEVGARDVIEKILPVVDNFERGLSAVPEEERANPVIEGMDKIYKQLMTVLTDLGVAPIEAAGQEFDPNLHNAVMHIEDEELGENIIAEEFQKGYTYKESVIRHSMVKVAN